MPSRLVAYLDTADSAAALLETIRSTPALAIDTEGASFHRFVDRIYLLQLSTPTVSAIIDPLAAGPLPGLGTVLEDATIEKVFHDADYDLRLLHQDYGWHVRRIFDTRIAAQLLGLKAFGLAALLERYFGLTVEKKHQRADWSQRPLSRDMLDYAAQDTSHLLELRERLHGELERMGRWEWAREEFGRLEGTRWPDEDPAQSFLKVKGARDLSRRELAILRELVNWRDDAARAMDRATFRVMSNEALLDVARVAPATAEALGGVKGVPRGMLQRGAPDLLDAVRRGLAVTDDELPRFPKSPRWARDPDFDDRVIRLKAVRDAGAARLGLDPGFLCGRERLETIARVNPASVEGLAQIPELRRWQIAELGEGFLAALTGRSEASPYRDA